MIKSRHAKQMLSGTVFLILVVVSVIFVFAEIAPKDVENVLRKEGFDHLPQSSSNLYALFNKCLMTQMCLHNPV